MRVMTFNLRFENEEDGSNRWALRKEIVVETILLFQPDLLATQEGTHPQIAYLERNLLGYRSFYPGRSFSEEPFVQYPTIFYSESTIRELEGGEFWLSETPSIPLSKSWNAGFPRLFTFGTFLHLPHGEPLCFANTHLDHVSSVSRSRAVEMILAWSRNRDLPIILCGDFNDLAGSPVHRALTLPGGSLVDTWEACGEGEGSTVHRFTGRPSRGRIDWILVSPSIRVESVRVITHHREGRYPSDHFPYMADLRMPWESVDRD